MKAHFVTLEEASDEPGVNEARGYGCEYVAWQFLTNLTEREVNAFIPVPISKQPSHSHQAIDFLLYDLPRIPSASEPRTAETGNGFHTIANEEAPLLAPRDRVSSYFGTDTVHASTTGTGTRPDEFTSRFENLSALEIAAVTGSKKFLSQRPVQKIINGLWRVCLSTAYFLVDHAERIRATLCFGKHSASTQSKCRSCIIVEELTCVRANFVFWRRCFGMGR